MPIPCRLSSCLHCIGKVLHKNFPAEILVLVWPSRTIQSRHEDTSQRKLHPNYFSSTLDIPAPSLQLNDQLHLRCPLTHSCICQAPEVCQWRNKPRDKSLFPNRNCLDRKLEVSNRSDPDHHLPGE